MVEYYYMIKRLKALIERVEYWPKSASEVTPKQLRELHIRLNLPDKK